MSILAELIDQIGNIENRPDLREWREKAHAERIQLESEVSSLQELEQVECQELTETLERERIAVDTIRLLNAYLGDTMSYTPAMVIDFLRYKLAQAETLLASSPPTVFPSNLPPPETPKGSP